MVKAIFLDIVCREIVDAIKNQRVIIGFVYAICALSVLISARAKITKLTKFDRCYFQDILAISDCSCSLGSIDDAQKDIAVDGDQAESSEDGE